MIVVVYYLITFYLIVEAKAQSDRRFPTVIPPICCDPSYVANPKKLCRDGELCYPNPNGPPYCPG